jgi:hypothetical protein
MTQFAMLTDEPERVLRGDGVRATSSVIPFHSAVGALVWERNQRSEGAVVLDSRGWRFGVLLTMERAQGQAGQVRKGELIT